MLLISFPPSEFHLTVERVDLVLDDALLCHRLSCHVSEEKEEK